jgi:capsular polysaccharide transport system permease protein
LLRGIINRAPVAIYGAQSLLYHRCITLLDILISKNLLEGAATTFVLLLFAGVWGLITGQWPKHLEAVLLAMLLLMLFSHGLCLLIAAGSVRTEIFERVTHLGTYLSMPFTGMLFMVSWLPTDLQHAALWIPTVHMYELLRYGFYGSAVPTYFDLTYVTWWVAGLNLFGMMELRRARRDLVI